MAPQEHRSRGAEVASASRSARLPPASTSAATTGSVQVIKQTVEAIAAAGIIGEYRRDVGVLAVTSADRLNAGWTAAQRERARGNSEAVSHVEALLGALPNTCLNLDLNFVRPMFAKSDMGMQRGTLAAALAIVVHHADNLSSVAPALEDMGRRHVGYGVTDAHYDSVGRALIQAIAEFHGQSFTPAIRDAWAAAYGAVASTMKAGAASGFRKSA